MTSSPKPKLTDNLYKLVIVGDYGVGKSSLVSRFCDNSFRELHADTIGIDYKIRTLVLPEDKTRIQLEIFDTAGLDKFRPIASAYYQNAAGVIIVYDVTDQNSFNSVERYIRELKYYVPPDAELEIVGTKSDLEERRAVPFEKAELLASQHGLSIFETSAKTGSLVDPAFIEIATRIREKIAVGTFNPDSMNGVVIDTTERGSANWCIFCCFS